MASRLSYLFLIIKSLKHHIQKASYTKQLAGRKNRSDLTSTSRSDPVIDKKKVVMLIDISIDLVITYLSTSIVLLDIS